jgi:hypothetical protein
MDYVEGIIYFLVQFFDSCKPSFFPFPAFVLFVIFFKNPIKLIINNELKFFLSFGERNLILCGLLKTIFARGRHCRDCFDLSFIVVRIKIRAK